MEGDHRPPTTDHLIFRCDAGETVQSGYRQAKGRQEGPKTGPLHGLRIILTTLGIRGRARIRPPLTPGCPVSRRPAPGSQVGPPAASGAPGRHGTRHERERGTARRSVVDPSRDQAVRDHLEEDRPHLRWCISLPIVAPVKMFQVPGPPVLKRLFDAVSGTHNGTGRERLRLTRSGEEHGSGDVTLALAHYARHQSRRLKPGEPLFGGPSVQTTVGVVDRNRDVHDFWTDGE
jgi:hypothetical protein